MAQPHPPQGKQNEYDEKPFTIYGEQYRAGDALPIGATDEVVPPVFAEGQPRVYLAAGGVKELHDTDWVLTDRYSGQPIDVVSDDEFHETHEPPRPLQEIEGVWVCSTNTVIQNPTNGQIRLNATTVEATTILALHKLTDANIDYSAALQTAVVGDVFYIQSAKEAKRWARVTLTGLCERNADEWYRVPVVWTEGSGVSFIEGNNKLLINLELSHRVDRTSVA